MNCIIEKGIKDRQHPYIQIARSLIDDKEASIGLRMLIITCLSKPDSWKYNVKNLSTSLGIGKETTYKYLKEGIQLGYVTYEQPKIKGKFSTGIWKIFEEKQELKKCLPHTGFPDTVAPEPENPDYSNNEAIVNTKSKRYIERNVEIVEPVDKHKKSTEKPVENVQHPKTKFRDREIPEFLKIKGLSVKDQQILANQFTSSELVRAKEDAKSYNSNREKIKNLAAFMTQRCKFYREKRMS